MPGQPPLPSSIVTRQRSISTSSASRILIALSRRAVTLSRSRITPRLGRSPTTRIPAAVAAASTANDSIFTRSLARTRNTGLATPSAFGGPDTTRLRRPQPLM